MVKMTLKELITGTTWVNIEKKMLAIYPEECDSLHYYKRLFWTLSNLEADENPTGAMIEFELFSDEDEVYYEDYEDDYDDYDDLDEEEFTMSLEKWKKFLGYFISDSLLQEIDEAEVITHAFVEATYGGFREIEMPIIQHNESDE